jgi:PLP dependent protein
VTTVEQIAARGRDLRRRIGERTDRDVRIVCVTKGHPLEVALAARDAGFDDLGENYAQDLVAKASAWDGPDPRWHFIGRLQSNKVRSLAGLVTLWQSVDRASVAAEIARRAPGAGVLVQVDLAGLAGRGGCPPEEAAPLVGRCAELGLDVEGVMGVGVPGPAEASRPAFRSLRRLADDLGLSVVSMGMSGDLEIAVEEGSTMVRVGSSLVGPRPTTSR